MLMAGLPHTLVANQLGTSVQMLERNYTKWIEGEETEKAMQKFKSHAKTDDRKVILFTGTHR